MKPKPLPVDENAKCRVCRKKSWNKGNPFLFCDECNDGYHASCAKVRTLPKTSALWFCRRCDRPTAGGGRAEYAAKPMLDKQARREQAGLHAAGPVRDGEVDIVLRESVAKGTREKEERTVKRFKTFCKKLGRRRSQQTLGLYVVERLKKGRAADTIKAEVGILRRRFSKIKCSKGWVKRLMRGVARLADVPSEAKAPLTIEDLVQLRHAIKDYPIKMAEEETRHARARDWTFYLLAFAGLLRGSEAAALRWSSLRFVWRTPSGVKALRPGKTPDGGRLQAVRVHILESKTDPFAQGQEVKVAARQGVSRHECPVQMLLYLWSLRRKNQKAVFAETRLREKPRAVTADTMRRRFKDYLGTFMKPSEVRRLSLHSLRKGGATAAAQERVPMRLIKNHGRWSSDAVYVYTLVSEQEALHLSKQVLRQVSKIAQKARK